MTRRRDQSFVDEHPAIAHTRRLKHARRRRRRRNAVKGLVMGAMVLSGQPKAKAESKSRETGASVAEVTVSIDSMAAVPPYLAYEDIIDEAARRYHVDADLIHAVIATESGFNPLAESPAGAQGLMQLMPALQAELGVTDAFDPRQNVMAGVQYLKKLLHRNNGDVALALASYNAGPTIVGRYKGVPPYKETREYIKKIKALLADAGD
jgi:soluble lytic murein transglycosylase-like protein